MRTQCNLFDPKFAELTAGVLEILYFKKYQHQPFYSGDKQFVRYHQEKTHPHTWSYTYYKYQQRRLQS